MKTASETFIEHLTAVVKTGLTEVLATLVITSSRRASSPRVDAQQGPAQSHTFLLTCQAWCPTCKGIALITKPSQASVFVQFPVSALMSPFQPAWPKGEVCPTPGTWRSSLCFFQCCWISGTPLRPQHRCNPKCLATSELCHKAAP